MCVLNDVVETEHGEEDEDGAGCFEGKVERGKLGVAFGFGCGDKPGEEEGDCEGSDPGEEDAGEGELEVDAGEIVLDGQVKVDHGAGVEKEAVHPHVDHRELGPCQAERDEERLVDVLAHVQHAGDARGVGNGRQEWVEGKREQDLVDAGVPIGVDPVPIGKVPLRHKVRCIHDRKENKGDKQSQPRPHHGRHRDGGRGGGSTCNSQERSTLVGRSGRDVDRCGDGEWVLDSGCKLGSESACFLVHFWLVM